MKNKIQHIISNDMKKYLIENNFSYSNFLWMWVHNVNYKQWAVFILISIENKKAKVKTPKTQKIHYCNLEDLYLTYNSFKKITGLSFNDIFLKK